MRIEAAGWVTDEKGRDEADGGRAKCGWSLRDRMIIIP